jgi:hypothetical protein
MLAFSLVGVVLGIAQMDPLRIPAVTCIIPYFLGVTLRRSPVKEPV